uniref:CCHC-type domain-containing protein n=1 Tax=Strongyloides papillosus TaxID=174720 RepID=A0A0N5C189_STREA
MSDKVCFKCSEAGHFAKSCPNSGNNSGSYNSGGRRGGDDRTFVIHKILTDQKHVTTVEILDIHQPRSCDKSDEGGNRQRNRNCFNCGSDQHIARFCDRGDDGDSKNFNNGRKRTYSSANGRNDRGAKHCYQCQGAGHIAKDCPEGVKCFKCGSLDHTARNCQD